MLSLVGYFDAGGHQDGKDVISVGGYLSSIPAWLRFEKEWHRTLKPLGIEEFHMTDFVACQDAFKDWKGREDEQARLLLKLAKITKKHVRRSFSGTLFLADWRRANEQYSLKESHCTPYALCAFFVMDAAIRYLAHRTRNKLRARFVFEDGDKGKGDFIWMIDQVVSRNKRMFKGIKPDFQGKELAPLQAADFVLWEQLYVEKKRLRNPSLGRHVSRDSFKELLGIKRTWGLMDYASLVRFCVEFEIPKRGEPMKTWSPYAVSPRSEPDEGQP